MKLEEWRDPATGDFHMMLKIDQLEIMCAKLTDFDRALFRECEESKSIADKLLALETMARRIEEQQEQVEEKDGSLAEQEGV